jgi:hypothetical protein
MRIRYGYRIELTCQQDLPLITLLDVHPSRRHDLTRPDEMVVTASSIPSAGAVFRNISTSSAISAAGWSRRLAASCCSPRASFTIPASLIPANLSAREVPPSRLPDEALVYLLGSRYCETDKLAPQAWSLFGQVPAGLVARAGGGRLRPQPPDLRLPFRPQHAHRGRGVRRAHRRLPRFRASGVALCRCLNIPARYCNGYLGDIGVPLDPAPMDFNAWFEVFLGGRWYTFDARHNMPASAAS